jgi:proline iminopeptidase
MVTNGSMPILNLFVWQRGDAMTASRQTVSDPIQSISLNGAEFAYQTAGADDGETIIVLHGGRGIGDHTGDFEAFRQLSGDRRLLAYDMRGCGRSSLTPPYTFDVFADDLEAFRQHFCGEGKLIVIGGSFGGMIALTYAVRHPHGLSHLILRGTAPSHHHEAEALANIKARLHKAPSASVAMVEKIFSDQIINDVELRLIWHALQPLYFETFDPDASLERTRRMYLHAQTHNALFADKSYDLRADLPSIDVPTLVIVGAEDWICPLSQSCIIADTVPGAELFVVESANHSVHIEANAAVIEKIRAFLKRSAGA